MAVPDEDFGKILTFHDEQKLGSFVSLKRRGNVVSKSDRVKLEMRILKYRQIARQMAANPEEAKRIAALVAELEQKLREIDE